MDSVELKVESIALAVERLGRVEGILETCCEFSEPEVSSIIQRAIGMLDQTVCGLIDTLE